MKNALPVRSSSERRRDKIIRKITKVGGHSYAVILPMEVVKKWGWQERQKVVLDVDAKKKVIKIKDWHRPSVARKGEGGKK